MQVNKIFIFDKITTQGHFIFQRTIYEYPYLLYKFNQVLQIVLNYCNKLIQIRNFSGGAIT